MTSFSTYGTGRMRLVEGSLSTDDELAEEQLYDMVQCVASGAARALLDTTRDLNDDDANVDATQWQSPAEGWETGAIVDDDLPAFTQMCERFVRENVQDILNLAHRIAWSERWAGEPWHGDEGMAIYRVGMLLGYTVHGDGIGFDDYFEPFLINGRVAEHVRDTVVDHLKEWVDSSDHPNYEGTWIDSSEEPCLLHLI